MTSIMLAILMARTALYGEIKARYRIDVTRYTAKERAWLFKPMNREGTIEPLVLITRANALDQDRIPPREEK